MSKGIARSIAIIVIGNVLTTAIEKLLQILY